MPEVPPDPRAVINEKIRHFKKQTQKLNLEVLEAEKELERAKEAVRLSRVKAETPRPMAVLAQQQPSTPPARMVLTIRPFEGGLGYALQVDGRDFWFDTEIHAINYVQDLYPQCEIAILNADGTVRHQYNASGRS